MGNGRTMRLADIRIPEKFAAHPPDGGKVRERARSAAERPLTVCVNSAGWLTDRYASYIAAAELGQETILAFPGRETAMVVEAAFHKGGKPYTWEVPDRTVSLWKKHGVEIGPGLLLAVRTESGVRQVMASRFGEEPFPTGRAEILGPWSREKYRPGQCAEHARLCREIGEYCRDRGIASLEEFLAAPPDGDGAGRLYQFATGRWANPGRLEQIRGAIAGAAAGRCSDA